MKQVIEVLTGIEDSMAILIHELEKDNNTEYKRGRLEAAVGALNIIRNKRVTLEHDWGL